MVKKARAASICCASCGFLCEVPDDGKYKSWLPSFAQQHRIRHGEQHIVEVIRPKKRRNPPRINGSYKR